MKKILITTMLLIAPAIAAGNPISDIPKTQASQDLKAHMVERYAPNYSAVELLYDAGMKDYKKLCAVPDSPATDQMLEKLKGQYYPNFSAILILFEANLKSYKSLGLD